MVSEEGMSQQVSELMGPAKQVQHIGLSKSNGDPLQGLSPRAASSDWLNTVPISDWSPTSLCLFSFTVLRSAN